MTLITLSAARPPQDFLEPSYFAALSQNSAEQISCIEIAKTPPKYMRKGRKIGLYATPLKVWRTYIETNLSNMDQCAFLKHITKDVKNQTINFLTHFYRYFSKCQQDTLGPPPWYHNESYVTAIAMSLLVLVEPPIVLNSTQLNSTAEEKALSEFTEIINTLQAMLDWIVNADRFKSHLFFSDADLLIKKIEKNINNIGLRMQMTMLQKEQENPKDDYLKNRIKKFSEMTQEVISNILEITSVFSWFFNQVNSATLRV